MKTLVSSIALIFIMFSCSPSSEAKEMENPTEVEKQGETQYIRGSFAIQNIQTGKNIRPYNAGTSNGNRIVLYDHNEWKCLTYEFVHVEGDIYQLKNLYTHKTIESSSSPEQGVSLWQQPLKEVDAHCWEFIKQSENEYCIRLKGTELYITISSDKTDSDIILMPKQNGDNQVWRLLEQYPTV